jgi:hypothetical protein
VSWNEWAPLVSIAGYRTAGGFVPNTTQHQVFSSIPNLPIDLPVGLASMIWTVGFL